MNQPACPICGLQSIIEVEMFNDGSFIGSCIHCDFPQEDRDYVYQNHCWNCGFDIDSRYSTPSCIPGMGFHCGRCGKDLSEWKL